MYRLILVNLSADARTVAPSNHLTKSEVSPGALVELLENFRGIDPIENAIVDAEIRISVRNENYLLRTAQAKLVFYDVRHRELPGQFLSLEEIMAELDGSAAAARNQSIRLMRAEAETVPEQGSPQAVARKRSKVASLSVVVLLLVALNFQLKTLAGSRYPEQFVRSTTAEAQRLQPSLTGVYLTGSDPGQHGIVVTGPGELKFFELGVVDAPRVVYAAFAPGRIGQKLFLATDQLGGLIEIRNNGTLVYCGENYQRIP